MSKKRYMVLLWLRTKNVAMEYVESLDVIRKIRKLYKHDRCEVVSMESFEDIADASDEKVQPERKIVPPMKGWATQVRCVETGEVWRSVAECHRKTGYGSFHINSACTTGRELNGRHYEYYREKNNTSVPSRLDADGYRSDEEK